MGGGYNGYVIYLLLPLAGGGISKIVTHRPTDRPTHRPTHRQTKPLLYLGNIKVKNVIFYFLFSLSYRDYENVSET